MKWIENLSTRVPIANWAPDLEGGALAQAKDLANLSYVVDHVALMSDCHPGKGMPIGGVIACKDTVIPNAVGVDIGCLDKGTEFLSPKGWVKISNWNKEKVLQYNRFTDTTNFVTPLKYIEKYCDKFYHFKTKYGMDEMLSPDHKMLVWIGYKSRGYKIKDFITEDFVKHHNSLLKGIQGGIKTTFRYDSFKSINLSDIMIRIQIMISADGCIRSRKTVSDKIELHFKKERKIKRALYLLKSANIKYKTKKAKDESTFIYFSSLGFPKSLKSLWEASEEQLRVVADECLFWDGHKGENHSFYSTTNKDNADLIQFALTVSGIRSNIYEQEHKNVSWNNSYIVYKTNNDIVGFSPKCITEVKPKDGMAYCFTVPTGYFIIRRNGYISITGNCGMGFIETDISVSDLTEVKVHDDNLIRTILKTIKKVVPVGFAHHTRPQDSLLLDNPSHDVMDIEIIKEELNKARYQVGTLGGGNHFIELQSTTFKNDSDVGNLCIMLHSGSRNFGYRIANHFNQLAQALGGFVYKGDEGLAHFDVNSEFGQQYIRAMNFALDFAKENRRVMMERIKNVVFNLIRKHTSIGNINILSETNIHHNYAALEQHYGEDVWVHRKGAICMSEGSVGIIPGSMGTPSYIVEGKGNKESFNSASHGSGRIMGRGAFNRQYSLEKAEKSMEGVEYLGWSKNRKGKLDLSEAPSAYKDIEAVIDAQSDLISIKIKLKPIGSVKS